MEQHDEADRAVMVVGSHDWSPWLEELFPYGGADCDFVYDDASANEDQALQDALGHHADAPIGFLSSHVTLPRDARVSEALRHRRSAPVLAPNRMQAELAWDKSEMVRYLKETPDVVFPESLNWDGMLDDLTMGQGDFIAKPRFGSTGELMVFFSTAEDAQDWRDKTAPDLSHFVFQRFVQGREVSVIAVRSGQRMTLFPVIDKEVNQRDQWQHPIWRRRFCPSLTASPELERRLQTATACICERLSAQGMMEVEFIVTEADELVFLEFNPRLSATTRICSLASERTVMDVFLEALLRGGPADRTVIKPVRHCVEFPVTPEEQSDLERHTSLAGQLRFDSRAGRMIATLSASTHDGLMTSLAAL